MKFLLLVTLLFGFAMANAKTEVAPRPDIYSVPLHFRPEDNGVRARSYKVTWDLSQKNSLQMGPLNIDSQSFVVGFFAAGSSKNPLIGQIADSAKLGDTLFVSWPLKMFPSGQLELISWDGSVLWSEKISEGTVEKWQEKLAGFKGSSQNSILSTSGVVLNSLKAEVLRSAQGAFRFCLTREEKRERSMLCTVRYALTNQDGNEELAQVVEKVDARVLVNQEAAPLKGSKPVLGGDIVNFFAETSEGVGFEFTSEVPEPRIKDLFRLPGGWLYVAGVEPIPLGAKVFKRPNDLENFWNTIGWQQTMGDLDRRWELQFIEGQPLMLGGRVGGIFFLEFDYKNLPLESDRVWLSKNDTTSTYHERSLFHVYVQPDQKLSAESPDSLTIKEDKPEEALWDFFSPKEDSNNTSSLLLETGKNKFKASLDVYRGYSSELSSRMSAAANANGEANILGEVRYSKWFQTFFDVDSDQWSTLRWGFSTRYFQSLSQVGAKGIGKSTTGRTLDLKSLNLTLKYRFNKGLWGRDETWGALADYDNLEISGTKAPLLGVGVFWGRSMPQIFDNIINFVPFMRFPKFVDMEISYFPTSMDSKIEVGDTYTTNFHGKILWTDTWFGEAGFAYKSQAITDRANLKSYNIKLFTVTAGIGINF